jgi:hypothetical protein
MKLKIVKGLFWLAIQSRWFKYWSKLYRFMFEKKYKKNTVEKVPKLETIHNKIKHLKWQPDGFKELYDVCRNPEYGQYLINNHTLGLEPPKGAFDCDDFASYCSAAFNPRDKNDIGKILTVTYIDETKKLKVGGHVVFCVYHGFEKKYSVLSNWGLELKKYNTIAEVVDYVLVGRQLIGYAFYNNNLDLLSVSLEK